MKKLLSVTLALFIVFSLSASVFADDGLVPIEDPTPSAEPFPEADPLPTPDPAIPTEKLLPLVVDNAGLLSSSEVSALEAKAERISEKYKSDVAIVTVNGLDGKDITEFTDNFYDDNGYGYGSTVDGVMLLVDMGSRNMHIATAGSAIDVFTDAGQKLLWDRFTPYMSSGNYYKAFDIFLDSADEFYYDAQQGSAVDADVNTGLYNNGLSPEPIEEKHVTFKDILVRIVASLGGGFLFGGIPVKKMKNELTDVTQKVEASRYIVNERSFLTGRQDRFLRNTISRVPIPKYDDRDSGGSSFHGGGSSIHISSSGTTHGGSSHGF